MIGSVQELSGPLGEIRRVLTEAQAFVSTLPAASERNAV